MAWNDPLKKTGDGADDRILSLCISTFGWIKHHLKWCLHQCNTCQRCNFRLDLGENYIFINTIHDIFATPPILIDVSIQELQCFFGGAWRIRPTCPLACCCWSLLVRWLDPGSSNVAFGAATCVPLVAWTASMPSWPWRNSVLRMATW